MAVVRDIVAWGRTLRNQTGIKIRQPLSSLTIENNKKKSVNRLKDLVLEELNIKEIHFIGQDKSQFYNYEGKIDFKILALVLKIYWLAGSMFSARLYGI